MKELLMVRAILTAATSLVLAVAAGPAWSQNYPDRPITLVVPFVPGGSASIVARSIADNMSEVLGQQIIIDTRGGAGGTIATRAVAKAPPDGYTLLVTTGATVSAGPSLNPNVGYDPRKDLQPIGMFVETPNVLAAHPSLGVGSVAELIKVGRAAPEAIPYGSPGVGSLNHLTGELIAHKTGIKMIHVPYKGAAPALNDLLGGHIKLLVTAIPTSASQLAAGTIRPLAITGTKRSAMLPTVPTFVEAGLPGIEVPLRFGLAAPAGTPRPIVDKLNKALNAALASDEVRKRLAAEGAEPAPTTPEEYAQIIDRELNLWSTLVKEIGLKPK
jgi:tripartite-type tricarboxylate transporter receptor subunit TctC